MSQPVVSLTDDDAGVVSALRGDLTRRFGRPGHEMTGQSPPHTSPAVCL